LVDWTGIAILLLIAHVLIASLLHPRHWPWAIRAKVME